MIDVFGRVAELDLIDRFLGDVRDRSRSLLLTGEPGIGKSTLWRRSIELAVERSFVVLSCQGAQTETTLSYAALDDLLQPVLRERLARLPTPQRNALQVAFFQAEADGPPLEAHALMLGVLAIIRSVAESRPVL